MSRTALAGLARRVTRRKAAPAEPAPPVTSPTPATEGFWIRRVSLRVNGKYKRLHATIPSAALARLEVLPGDELVITFEDNQVIIRTHEAHAAANYRWWDK